MGEWFTGVLAGAVAAVFGMLFGLSGTKNIDIDKWTCTAQVIVNDTLPSEYKCIQYTIKDTIKDKEIKKLTQGVKV